MFELCWTAEAQTQYEELKRKAESSRQNRIKSGKTKSSKAEGLLKQVAKAIDLLSKNPKHPSLNSHPFDSLQHPYDPNEKVWEVYAQNDTPGAHRVFYCYGPKRKQLTIVAITPHP